jgi:transposase
MIPTGPPIDQSEEVVMEVIVDRCAGLDVHNKTVVACVRSPGVGRQKRHSEVRTFGTFEHELVGLRDWLGDLGVTQVAMEATGVYWKPVWQVLDDGDVFEEILLVNPAHVKNVPGRKTDVNDATWIGQLLECGVLRGSFVPPAEIRQLREITRYRRQLTEERSREVQRLQKLLEDANVKLTSVVTHTLGVTGRMILDALCAGERDPEVLAGMAKGRLRDKAEFLRQCVPGRFNEFHAVMTGELLAHIDYFDAATARLDEQIDRLMAPFAEARDRFDTIPGIGKRNAEIIVAEIGIDMTRFPDTSTPRLVGRAVSGQQRISRETQTGHDPFREPVAHLGAGRGRLVSSSHQRLLPRRPVQTDSQATRRTTSADRHRSHHLGDLLAPPRRSNHLHRTGHRLPRRQRPTRTAPTTPHRPTRTTRLHRATDRSRTTHQTLLRHGSNNFITPGMAA